MSKSTQATGSTRIGVGLARQSKTRDGSESIAHQVERIKAAAAAHDIELVAILEEPGVSGGANLERRHGLRTAVEMVESPNGPTVIVAAYFDRFFRSLKVQGEVMERIERAGGKLLTADTGAVANGNAGEWLTSTTLGMLAEYHRRVTNDRTQDAIRDAVADGRPPFPNVTPAYRRREDGTLELDPVGAPLVAEAFAMRARGLSVAAVVAFLNERGIPVKWSGLQAMLASPLVLGELRHGRYVNLHSHEPAVSREVWEAVQRTRVTRGRYAKSERLLARLGIVRCQTCDGPMTVDSRQGRQAIYRCSSPNRGCTQRALAMAVPIEDAVRDEVIRLSAALQGRADVDADLNAATAVHEQAQAQLDRAIKSYGAAGVLDEPASIAELTQLRAERDRTGEHAARLRAAAAPALTVTTLDDWKRLSPTAQRDLVRALVARVIVRPGRGPGRFTIFTRELVTQ